MTFDPTKPVQTRDGRSARIICTDKKGEAPIVALVSAISGDSEITYSFFLDGSFYCDDGTYPLDLVNTPEEKTLWLNVYHDGVVNHLTKEVAERCAGQNRIACIKVTYKEGQFDDE